jgi:hypothetical protein
MMKPILLLFAAAALLPAPACAQAAGQTGAPAAPAAWKPFTPAEGMLSVLLPGEPKRSETPIPEDNGGPGRVVLYTSARPEGVFLVGWADYAPSFKFDPQTELNLNRDNFVNGVQAKLLATRAISFNGAPGIEFDMEKTGAWTGRARVYILGGKPYQLIAINGGTTLDSAKATRLFDSFRVLPRR